MVMMEKPSPIQVGREFVRQYYTLLNKAPELLYRFYSMQSSYVHGGKYCNGEPEEPVIGQSKIHLKIDSLDFHDCHTKIRQVDAHSTIGSGVVVQVTGELSNGGNPLRRFMQTFVLGPQGDNPYKFYVHNDIFRYQDEVFMDDVHSEHSDNEQDDEVIEPPQMTPQINTYQEPHYNPVPVKKPPPVIAHPEPVLHPVSNVSNGINQHEFEPVHPASSVEPPTTPSPVPPQSESSSQQPLSPREIVRTPSPDPQTETEVAEPPELEPEESIAPPPAAPCEVVVEEGPEEMVDSKPSASASSKAFSWADMASKNTPIRKDMPVGTTVKITQPPPEPVEPIDIPPRPTRAPRLPPTNPRSGAGGGYSREDDRGDRGDIPRRIGGMGGPGGPIRYPDNQQIFVGNLPYDIMEGDLRDHFTDFGKVIEVRINYSHTNNPSFGFVIFEDPKAVDDVLSVLPTQFKNNHRINIEEKKQRSRDNNRPRGGMGGGDQRRMGGQGMGDMRGGRRGGGPPMMRRDRQGSRDGPRQYNNAGPRR